MKRIAALILLFFGTALVLALLGTAAPVRAQQHGQICHPLEKIVSLATMPGTRWQQIYDESALNRARDLYEALPPVTPRPRGGWLIVIDADHELFFGFVTGTTVCDMVHIPAAQAALVRQFLIGNPA